MKIKEFIQTYENFFFSILFFLVAWPILYYMIDLENTTYRIIFYILTILYLLSNVAIFVLTYMQNNKNKSS
ncbi:hypothetical protein ACFSCX_13115 [Bacillus salitolerans]|uniref:Uncharacterized protein n=1 Tax=Bacillus salitolerans TaxID=1437434 RepID=A0ABW4LQP2_9BACI